MTAEDRRRLAEDRETSRYHAQCAEKRARETLIHYFDLAGAPASGENGGEIASIVDDIVRAAAARARVRILEDVAAGIPLPVSVETRRMSRDTAATFVKKARDANTPAEIEDVINALCGFHFR